MRNKISDLSGFALLEGVTALLILCLSLTSVMLLAGIVIRGEKETETAYTEAFELNSLRDQIAEKINALSDHSPAAVASAVGSIVASRKGWGFQILSNERGLLTLLLIYETDDRRHEHKIRIYAGP